MLHDMKYFNIRALKLLRDISNKQSKQEARIKANGLRSHGLESLEVYLTLGCDKASWISVVSL